MGDKMSTEEIKYICPLMGSDKECIMTKQINNINPNRICTFYDFDRNDWKCLYETHKGGKLIYLTILERCKFLIHISK